MKSLTERDKRKIVQNVVGYLYIAPVLLGILFFTFTPVFYAFITSFFETELKPFSLTDWGTFVGFKNYYQNFTNYYYRSQFFTSLGVTFLYAVTYIPLSLILSFLLALLLNQKLSGMRFFRVLYYLPVLIPAVCSGMLWNRITDPDWGSSTPCCKMWDWEAGSGSKQKKRAWRPLSSSICSRWAEV